MKIKHKKSKWAKFLFALVALAILLVGFYCLASGEIASMYSYLKYEVEFFRENNGPAGEKNTGAGGLVPILLYQNVTPAQIISSISIQNLKDQLLALKEAGYKTITLNQFNEFSQGKLQLPAKSFLLTFGGSGEDVYDTVDPLLKALDDHAVMLVSSNEDSGNATATSSMSAGDAENMLASGRWDVATSTRLVSVRPGKGFTQNSIGEAMPEKDIKVQSDWTADDLLNVLNAGSPKNLPLSENLNSNSNDWFVGWGGVRFSGNGAVINSNGSSTSGGIFLDGSQSWVDYSFDANVDWITADTITLYARYQNANNYAGCEFSQSGVRIMENVNGSSTKLFESDGFVPTSTINLGIRVISDKIECVLNGSVIAYAYGASPSLSSGAIGLSVWSKIGKDTSVIISSASSSIYNSAQEYAQIYNLNQTASSTGSFAIHSASSLGPATVLTKIPPAPSATPIQELGSQSVFANWIAGTYSTLTADTSLYTQGTQSLSLTTDGVGDLADAMVINQGPYNLTNKYLEIWIRVSTTTNVGDLWFVASSNDLHGDSYTWKLNRQILTSSDESEIQPGEWVPMVLTFDSDGDNMVTTGTPNIMALNSFELHISDKEEGPLTVWLGGISAVSEPPQATLTIVLDNGWSSEYTLAMPVMAKYGLPGVIAEIPETANDANFMSTPQLQYLQNDLGWDIACHTWDHIYELGLPNTTIPIIDSEFAQCKNWLLQNGLGKASNILVWPDGSNSPLAITEASKYFVTARGIISSMFNTLPVVNPMLLYATEFGGDTPTSTLDADVDRCMANHEWCIFYGHIIATSTPTNQDEYASSSFNDFVQHIAQISIPVKTITQVLENESQLPAPSIASLQSPIVEPPQPIISTASSTPTPIPDLSLPYTESNFTGDANWQQTWGTVMATSSGYMDVGANASTTGGSVILNNSNSWTDYTFNATLDWNEGQTFGLIARYINNENYTVCEFEEPYAGDVHIELRQYINGNEELLNFGDITNYNQLGGSNIDAYIQVQSTNETCSFNNHVVSNAGEYTLSPPFNGGIGFTTWDSTTNNSQIVVKNISVEESE